MNSDLRIASDLRRAADYLRIHGWIQGRVMDQTGAVCLVGVLCETAPATDYLLCKESLGFDELSGEMIDWNNAPGRTLEEVLDRLESTALGLEIKALSETLEVAVPLESVSV